MKAMLLKAVVRLAENRNPLELAEMPVPAPGGGNLLVKVSTCGVCHTDLDEIEGRTALAMLPIVPGHQAVGRVVALGEGVSDYAPGDRVGRAWIYSACGACGFCRAGDENRWADLKATGRDAHGGLY